MLKTFRKTTQCLAPAIHLPNSAYNPYPGQPIEAGLIEAGFRALARRIAAHERIVLDGMSGVMWEDFRIRLVSALNEFGLEYEWLDVGEALLPEPEIIQITEPFAGNGDPLFGRQNTRALLEFFVPERLVELRRRAETGRRIIFFGTGAALAATGGFLIYVDVPKNEVQFRSRAGSVTNLGFSKPDRPKAMYKRYYFVDWPPLRRHQAELLPKLDLIVDSQRPEEPVLMSGNDFRAGLAQAARSWFRVRPWFEPGPWGGQWMKQRIVKSSPEAPNLAWSFELISPENGLAFSSEGRLFEAAFDWLMFRDNRAVLGDFADRFGHAFPIRFDYLDTFNGGNLSLQCHPGPDYVAHQFGERFTQDETYYIADCAPGAEVFLGFQQGVDAKEFHRALDSSVREQSPLDVGRFVQRHPAARHGLYLIPNGTVHCSGRNNLVLEISATPYIFTFKMYDWMRLDLDGQPRPLNIERAMENLHFDRQGKRILREFIAQPWVLSRGRGWELVHLPTHAEHFYDVHRYDFTTAVQGRTEGSPHVLNVVEGSSVVLETPGDPPQRFAFAETFVVPAAAESYRLTSDTGAPVKVVKAFLKPSARPASGHIFV
jgi:mannose-6-phosphate isomerase class I